MFFSGPDNSQTLPLPLRRSGSPFNAWFLGPTRISPLNVISIGLAVLTELTNVSDRHTGPTRYSVCSNRPLSLAIAAIRPNNNNNNNNNNKHYCVLSNSGLSNATSKRPKLAFFRGKICPPQSQNCQNQILHISKINFYFGFR